MSDFLSFSPSILQIISLLDQPDVLHCKLVNRRLHGIVSRNDASMPRLPVNIHLGECEIKNGTYRKELAVGVCSEDGMKVKNGFCITDRDVTYKNPKLVPLFSEKEKYQLKDGEPAHERRFRSDVLNSEEGLRTLGRWLCNRYHINKMVIGTTKLYWTHVFSREFAASRAQCRHLSLHSVENWPGIGTLETIIESRLATNCLSEVLSIVTRWDRNMMFSREMDRSHPIVQLIDMWKRGLFCFESDEHELYFSQCDDKDKGASWGHHELVQTLGILSSLKVIEVPKTETREEHVVMLIKVPSKTPYLCLGFMMKQNVFRMYCSDYDGKPEDFCFQYSQKQL